MYLNFYGLTEKPFNPTPDPRFLYMSPGHREALAQLQYGVQERKGFIVLTGQVGTGKTTLVHALRQRLKVLDSTAFSLCMDNKLSMIVFGVEGEGNVARAIRGERIGTLVTAG